MGSWKVGLSLMVLLAERSAVMETAPSVCEETPYGIDLDGHRAGQGRATTRIVALESPSETILKAQLRKDPAHPRALATLLEAIALWQGQPVRAALYAEGSGLSCDSTICRGAFLDDGGALYSLVWVPAGAHRRRRQRLEGLGNFQDLERLVI